MSTNAPSIEQFVKHIHNLPVLPAVVVELQTAMEREDFDLQALGEKLALDQSLAAKTLRLANSSFFGLQSKVTTIRQAVSILGVQSIRSIVTACAVTGNFPPSSAGHFDFKAFWRQAVGAAVCARLIAPRLDVNPETAFTAGLLHDIGALVLATRMPDQYVQMLAYRKEHDCHIEAAELAVFGYDHALAGSMLTAHWRFPAPIQQAVREHHQREGPFASPLSLVTQASNTLAHALDFSGIDDDLAPPMAQTVWDALRLDGPDAEALLAEIEKTYQELSRILVD